MEGLWGHLESTALPESHEKVVTILRKESSVVSDVHRYTDRAVITLTCTN